MNIFQIVLLSLLLFLLTNCVVSKSVLTAENTTQPVLVGNVVTIGGSSIDSSQLKKIKTFSASVVNDFSVAGTTATSKSSSTNQGSGKIDKVLSPLIDNSPNTSKGIVIVSELEYSVVGTYLLFVYMDQIFGALKGAKYYY